MRQQQFPPLTQEEATAEVEALETIEAQHTGVAAPPVGDVNTYYVEPQDQAAWIPAWKLEVGFDGVERGRPIRLPKGQLDGPAGLLRARRPDGGRAFTVIKPEHLQEAGTLPCIVVNNCTYRARRKVDLVEHAEAKHPVESKPYATIFAKIREQVIEEDPRAKALVAQLLDDIPVPVATPQPVVQEIAEEPVKQIVPKETEPGEMNLAVQRPSDCPLCYWVGPARGMALSLGTHINKEHKGA